MSALLASNPADAPIEVIKDPSLSLTCRVCQTTLATNALQRSHAKTDWHIYNLKRRIVSLPPLSAQVFHDQVLGYEGIADAADIKVHHNHPRGSHRAQKAEGLNISLEGLRLASNKSGETEDDQNASDDREEPASSSQEEEEEAVIRPFVSSTCLFCSLDSSTFELSLEHMQKEHGLFIPDRDYLIDLETFIGYLFTIIDRFHECLYCGATKSTGEAARQHMIGKGHCKINSDEESDLEEFYDFSSIEDDPDHKNEKDDNEEKKVSNIVPTEDDELHLPSGRTVGHRSQARNHSRQSPLTSAAARAAKRNAITDSGDDNKPSSTIAPLPPRGGQGGKQLTTTTRGYNGLGMIGVSELQKRTLRAVEKKIMKIEIRARNEYQASLQKAANKQKYFKPDVPGPTNG